MTTHFNWALEVGSLLLTVPLTYWVATREKRWPLLSLVGLMWLVLVISIALYGAGVRRGIEITQLQECPKN